MKKIMIITVIFLALVLSSCDVLNTYTVKVKNNCGFGILVKFTQTSMPPILTSDYDTLANGATVSYPERNYGTNYLHIKDPFASGNRFYTPKDISVTRDDTLTITWNGSAYVVTPQSY